jgi:hypothetical protein
MPALPLILQNIQKHLSNAKVDVDISKLIELSYVGGGKT